MKVIIGFLIISAGFFVSLEHLDQKISQYWDVIAFSIVIFGTFAVSIMTAPSLKLGYILNIFKSSLFANQGLRGRCVKQSLDLIEGKNLDTSGNRIEEVILRDGSELVHLGIEPNKVKDILVGRVERYISDSVTVANWVKGLSKYPPAFGLAGTVLGLIHLMKGLAEGTDPKETGLRMAIALVATFYGILVANVLINPIGDRIYSNTKEDQNLAEISLNAVLMKMENSNKIEVHEQLNNYLVGSEPQLDFHAAG